MLFKVARKHFEQEDSAFSHTFKLPPVDNPFGHEGSSDENPLPLHGVAEAEFRALLWVMHRP